MPSFAVTHGSKISDTYFRFTRKFTTESYQVVFPAAVHQHFVFWNLVSSHNISIPFMTSVLLDVIAMAQSWQRMMTVTSSHECSSAS